MKKMMTFGFALVAAFCALSTFAATWVDATTNLKWTYDGKTNPATIKGGDYQDWTATITGVESLNTNGWMATELEIPAYINNYRVTQVYAPILCNEFLTNVAPEKVTIPENAVVTGFSTARDVNEEKFGLQFRTWYTNQLAKAGVVMFQDYLLTATNGVVTIPSNCTVIVNTSIMNPLTTNIVWGADCQVEKIEDYAMSDCSNLKNLTIPDSVTKIGYQAFPSSLTNMTFGAGLTELPHGNKGGIVTFSFGENENITKIDSGYFKNCVYLTNIVFSATLTKIEESAFADCLSLTKLDLSKTEITTIGANAFSNCTALAEVILPETIESIGMNAFCGCSKLEKINFPASLTDKYDKVKGEMTYGISEGAFKNTALKNIDLSETGVTIIQGSAFEGVGTATNVAFNSKIFSINDSAFFGCTNLTKITLPESLKYISSKAFAVDYVEGVTNGVATIAFDGDVELTSVQPDAFEYTKYYYNQLAEKGFKILELGGYAYGWDGEPKKGETVTFGTNVNVVGSYLFDFDENPKKSVLTNITKVVFANTVTKIGVYAFEGLENLTEVVFPTNTLNEIGSSAFANTGIKTIDIVGDDLKIDYGAFKSCTNLTSVKIDGLWDGWTEGDPTKGISCINDFLFQNDTALKTVKIGEGPTKIKAYAFQGCTNLTSVVLGSEVAEVGTQAFENCYALTNLEIGAVSTVNGCAFLECRGIKSIVLADDVLIGNSAFCGCSNLLSVTCANGGSPIYIFGGVFDGTPFITNEVVTIGGMLVKASNVTNDVYTTPAGITRIAMFAYDDTCSFSKVILSDELEYVGYNAFYYADWSSSKVVVINNNKTKIYQNAFPSDVNYVAEKVGYNFNGDFLTAEDKFFGRSYSYILPKFSKVSFRTDPTQNSTATQDTDFTGNETYTGWLKDGSSIVGQITVKAGKVNAKTGTVKLTTTINFLGGKKTYTETVGLDTNKYGVVTAATTRRSVDGIELSGDWLTGSITIDGVDYTLEGGSDVTTTDKNYFKDYVGTWNLVFQTKSGFTGSTTSYNSSDRIALTKGYTIVTVKIDKNGKVKATGTLADGTKVSATSKLVAGDNGANCASIMFVAYGNYQYQCKGKGGFGFLIWTYLDKDGMPVLYVKNDDVGSLSSCGNWIFPVFAGQEPWVYIPMSCEEAGAFVKGDNLDDGLTFSFDNPYAWMATFNAAVDGNAANILSIKPNVMVWNANANCFTTDNSIMVDAKSGKWTLASTKATGIGWLKATTKDETLAKYAYNGKDNKIVIPENWNGKSIKACIDSYADDTWEDNLLGYLTADYGFKKVNGVYDLSTMTKGNLNNLKFSYNKNTGLYTGSYTLYWVKSTNVSAPQLKKTTIYINGAVIDGKGFGNTLMKKVGSFKGDIM